MKVLLGNSLSSDLRGFFKQAAVDGLIEVVEGRMSRYINTAAFAEDIGDVNGEPVVIIQSAGSSGTNTTNDYAMQLAFAIDALKNEANAGPVWVIMPHFCYDRQDKSRPGHNDGIGARAFSQMLKAVGADGFSVIEAHSEKAMDFVRDAFGDANVYNLDPSELYAEHLKENGMENAEVIGPDKGSDPRADHLQKLLNGNDVHARLRKHRSADVSQDTEFDGMEGDISGKDVVMVDDVCDSGGTFSNAGKHAKTEGGAKSVSALVAAGTFANDGLKRVYEAKTKGENAAPVFDKIMVLDTVDTSGRLAELEREYPDAKDRVEILNPGPLLLGHITHDIANHPTMKLKK